jgi:hypothetical protein
MAKKVRIKLNSAGARDLLRSPEIAADIDDRTRRIAEAAGGSPDFEASVVVGTNRVHGSVNTATQAGREAEANDRALTRAIDAGR